MSTVNQIYKRTEVIGRGKFGIVYKGIHRATKQVYAIKVLNLDTSEDEVKDVQQEIQFLSHLKHVPNVTHYYGSYLNGTKLWIIMDYCAGGSLRTLLKPGRIEEKYIGVIVREVLIALQYIHRQNVIHRDIKAANVLITNEGKVMLCDFGVAAQLSSTSLRRNTMAGTPYWMAPEVIMEGTSYDVKADIWSLGITIYEIATGNPPYCDKEALRAMQLITKSKPPRLDGMMYSALLKEIIALCLDENPTERLTAEELLRSKFIKLHKNSPTSLLKELISRYLLWREKKSSRESIIMNVEDEHEDNEIEVKWDFDSLSSNEYILENDINVNNINLNENGEDNYNFENGDYDDGDDEFMTGYPGISPTNAGTINYTNANTTNITYNKNTVTYNNNIGSTLKANGTMNRKEAPKSLLQLFEEGSDEDDENGSEQADVPRIPSSSALYNHPGAMASNSTTAPRTATPTIVEIEIPNMDDIEPTQREELLKTRSRANTLLHSQSAAVLETRKTLDPGLQRRPTLQTSVSSLSQAPTMASSQQSLQSHASSGTANTSQPSLPAVAPPTIVRLTPSPKRELNNLSSPSKLNTLTSSPSKTNLTMKAIQSPNNPSPLLQPLNASLNANSQQAQATPPQSQLASQQSSKPQVRRNPQNLRLQMPTPTSLSFPNLLSTSSNSTLEDQDENLNQFGVNVSSVPMAMTPLTEKQNPTQNILTAPTPTTGSVPKRKMTNPGTQPPHLPFLQRAGSSLSSQSSAEGGPTSSINPANVESKVGAPTMDMTLFVDSEYTHDKLNAEMFGFLNGLSNMLGLMEEKLTALNE